MIKRKKYLISALTTFLIVLLALTSFAKDKVGGSKNNKMSKSSSTNASGKNGDSYRLNINNVNIPVNNRGIIAAVNIPPDGSGGKFAGQTFLFSSGFFLSGVTNNTVWANAVASASLVEDYIPGTYEFGENDARNVVYVVKKEDAPFSQSWQDWKDAVSLGADFYDGDGDGQYIPSDKNANGLWDTDEDMPDLLGDETVWCVYNDGKPATQRRYTSSPQGIEVRQTVFAFASKGAIGNIVFVRYRIKNTGAVADLLNDVYFGVWADPDLGNHKDDLVGSDILRNAGYVYNSGDDDVYGSNPPCFLIDFFSGPVNYIAGETYTDNNTNGQYDEGIDTPLDTAYSVRGQLKGIEVYPGAKNLGISSFVHYQQGSPPIQDPNNHLEARNYTLGLDSEGNPLPPCTWKLGKVFGADCNAVDNKFWYSGDPVTQTGWINTVENDQRQMQNTGPFKLAKGNEVEIVVAYVVGQGSNGALSSVTEAKRIDDGAQFIFDKNFQTASPAPVVNVEVKTDDNHIDLYWKTPTQVKYTQVTDLYDVRFEGFNVYAYRTNSTQELVEGVSNVKLIANYDLNNFINNIYKENEDGIPKKLYPESTNKLDYNVYIDEKLGSIRLTIDTDPFTGGPIVKGKQYYFAITSYLVNYSALYNMNNSSFGVAGDYALSNKSLFGEVENIPKIVTVVAGENIYDLTAAPLVPERISGSSSANIKVDLVNKEELTGNTYEVTFAIDSSSSVYSTYYSLKNKTTDAVLIDKSKTFLYEDQTIAIPKTEGFILRVSETEPVLGQRIIEEKKSWISTVTSRYYYVSNDLPTSSRILSLTGLDKSNGTYLKADKIKRVELRFGENGKAYRYLNGYVGSVITKRNSYVYGAGVSASDTVNNGQVGKLGEGFVDVPFTAWVEDPNRGERRQLAVGFIEKASKLGGKPDGVWDPGTSVTATAEYILIFDTDYDPTGNQLLYKGGFQNGSKTIWADLRGGTNYPVPAEEVGLSSEDKKIIKSAYFNTLYVVGIEKRESGLSYTSGDKFVIPVNNYPNTQTDVFQFTTNKGGILSDEQEKDLFSKVNVFPNPLFGYNVGTSYTNSASDEPFVTFTNLPPDEVTIKIFSLSGVLLRTLTSSDKSSLSSPFIKWNLQNDSGLRVASGMYLAIVSSPEHGEKILKFAIIMPQKQLPKY